MKKNRLRLVCLAMVIGASLVASNSSPASGHAPASNAAIAPMTAKVLGLELPSSGDLDERALDETLVRGPETEHAPEPGILQLKPATNDATTSLSDYQQFGEIHYFDPVSVTGRPAGLKTVPDTGGPSLLSFIAGVMLVVCGALGLVWVLLKRDS